jgi:hypothetical protein
MLIEGWGRRMIQARLEAVLGPEVDNPSEEQKTLTIM